MQTPPSSNDPFDIRVKVDPAVQFSERGEGSETTFVASDSRTGKFYRFGNREYHAASLMDGEHTLAQINEQLRKDGVDWSAEDVLKYARELVQHRLAHVQPDAIGTTETDRPNPNDSRSHDRRGSGQRVLGWMSKVLSQRIPLADGDRIAEALLGSMGKLFQPTAIAVLGALIISGVAVVWTHHDALTLEVKRIFDRGLWLSLAVLWCLLKVIHECGHAVCAKRLGVRVGKMGVLFFLFAPLAYVDVTNAWKLPRRRDRIQIALAGVYVELIVGAIAAWIWYLSPVGMIRHVSAHVFLLAGPATILVNANPLLRLDGYYVFSDLTEIPNLRDQGRKRLLAWIERILFGIEMPQCHLSGWRRDIAVIHALCSVIFQIAWMMGLVIAIAAWAKGLGIVIAAVAVTLWAVVPLVRWMCKIWTTPGREGWVLSFYQRRLLTLSSTLCVVIHLMVVSASPFSRRVPVVVRYHGEQIERAPVGAFVAAIYVTCGQRVERGELLVELEQPELTVKRNQLADQLAAASRKAIQHRRRGELAMANALTEKGESLRRQIEELDQQVASLRIVADRQGQVTSSTIDQLHGRYVKLGDEIIRISDPQEKELLAVVSEDNLIAFRNAVQSETAAKIRLRGGPSIQAALAPLHPAASRRLPHPALSASNGGPLPIEPKGSDGQMLVSPQLQSVIPLDVMTSMKIKSGQIGRLTIPDDRSLVARLNDYLRERR
ncbi:site-2 protease family protein [Roseiconus lacunae]|uniref:Biotin/lipoyl-binding protein n=1 Tax=Roseiconus lacunae TaxID=2605694 RepID=A0ABT7PNG3_9BACT|nr:site-2 protease family protein [Roseiconus lacunae]MDM4018039.1 biotin/lipoyl-binding protein [Roseiconus lacunae]